ncbi:hypothetical protein EPO17_01355 [Patescibacteria group bacterium]|nr:MAG: hypothetical protein EPO17_01355 [Patescibacteria group bacterium]
MSKIITYRYDREYGYCQIELVSGEKVLLSEAVDYIKILKLSLGFIPIDTIWKWHRTNDPKEPVLRILNNYSNESFFDSLVKEIRKYSSVDEIRNKFGK